LLSNRFSPSVYLFFEAGASFSFALWSTLTALYRIQTVGLDPFQLILLGTVLELTVFVLEVPTGIVADIYSRRLSVIIGTVLMGLGFMLEGLFPFFVTVVLAQVLWGVGATFESGARDAWLTDEVGEEKAGQLFLRSTQLRQIGIFLAIPLAVGLSYISLNTPLIAGGACYLFLAIGLFLFLPETTFQRHEAAHNPFAAINQTFRAGLGVARVKPVLITIFTITAILGASSETFDRLWEAHTLDIGLPSFFNNPALAFGAIEMVSLVLVIAVTQWAKGRVRTEKHEEVARALLILNVLLTVSVIGFGLASWFYVALAFYWASVALRTLNGPLSRAWLNQSLESKTRATVFSMNNQMDAIGQLAGGPLLGLVANRSISLAFVIAGLLLVPASFLYFRTLRNGEVQTE
jgi:MFS transporter, DHA3 family, tetracycline resistance protein